MRFVYKIIYMGIVCFVLCLVYRLFREEVSIDTEEKHQYIQSLKYF